ncbi:hypothetical protein [Pseudogracilibacillus sp. SO30301A]|uniref:hypothetical protein n=1 Tax=Pseudogracilibacillus sp. SO30301A TaxID=3098291 RepID=UPI00300DE5E4
MSRIKLLIGILVLVGIILSGCSGNEKGDWETSPTFTSDNMTLHGVQDKFGIVKVNGKGDEPEFPVDEGRQYQVYFLQKDFNGESYKMTATHEGEEEVVKLYEADIEDKQSGAKLGFDKGGLWKVSVSVDEKPYTDFIIEVE